MIDRGALPGRKPWILAVRATRLSCAWTSFSMSATETVRSTRRSRPDNFSTTGCIRDLLRECNWDCEQDILAETETPRGLRGWRGNPVIILGLLRERGGIGR